jgi:hypothetical protein
MIMENKTVRIRRLGSITFGVVLIALGIAMIINIFLPLGNIAIVFRFWPAVLIILGIEVLLGNRYKSTEIINPGGQVIEQNKIVYDFAAIIMMSITLLFTFIMAWADWFYVNHPDRYFYW